MARGRQAMKELKPKLPRLSWKRLTEIHLDTRSQAARRCGIHVHIAGSAFHGRKLTNLAKITYKRQKLIIRALGLLGTRLAQCSGRRP